MKNRAKELTEAILHGDIEALKEMKKQAKPIVIAFREAGQEPSSYYVVGHGMMSRTEYNDLKKTNFSKHGTEKRNHE